MAAERGGDPGLDGARAEGLADVVKGPVFESLYGAVDCSVGRNEDERQARLVLANPPQKVQSVDHRHLHIADDDMK